MCRRARHLMLAAYCVTVPGALVVRHVWPPEPAVIYAKDEPWVPPPPPQAYQRPSCCETVQRARLTKRADPLPEGAPAPDPRPPPPPQLPFRPAEPGLVPTSRAPKPELLQLARNARLKLPPEPPTSCAYGGWACGEWQWASANLLAMNEPVLQNRVNTSLEAYRFLWLRTFHHPYAVRVVRSEQDTILVATELSGAGMSEPGGIIETDIRELSGAQWQCFKGMIDASNFWQESYDGACRGADGADWILEGVRRGQYHVVNHHGAYGYPAFGDACMYLAQLAGMPSDGHRVY